MWELCLLLDVVVNLKPQKIKSVLKCVTLMKTCFFKAFIYLFLERGERKEKERKRNINVWLPLERPLSLIHI